MQLITQKKLILKDKTVLLAHREDGRYGQRPCWTLIESGPASPVESVAGGGRETVYKSM